jgi:membrane associated rhomboid family serine protease
MDRPGDPQIPPPPAPTLEYCYRHPNEPTRVHCTRCGRPICPACMVLAPVGHQCPECVQQARREFRQGPGKRITVRGVTATKVFLVTIIGVFVLEMVAAGAGSLNSGASSDRLLGLGALQPFLIADGDVWRLFTAMFLHANLFHILFNAWALWVFGTMVERDFGTPRFVALFFVTGLLASATSYAFGPDAAVGVGASGAIFGIFGAFVAYNYRRRHLALAAANLRWATTLLLINVLFAFSFGAIDWRAHLGGFVAGVLAGLAAEGWGSRQQRTLITTLGFAGLALAGVALVLWRTSQLQALPEFDQAVRFFRLLAS